MWQSVDQDEYVEILPLDDDKEHWAGDECWCQPTVDRQEVRPIIIHNSADGREMLELFEAC